MELAQKLKQEADSVDYKPVQALAMYWLGSLFDLAGEYKQAENSLHEAAQTAGDVGDGLLAAQTMALLVWVVGYQQARHTEALYIARDTKIMLGVAGGDDYTRAHLLNTLGTLFDRKGDYDKALDYYRQAMLIREKTLGSDHPEVAKSLNNIGLVYWNRGEYNQTLAYHQQALAIKEKALGPEHPGVALSLNNLGGVFQKQGKYKKALEYYQKALAIKEKALGKGHLGVALTLNNIGGVFQERGHYNRALDHYRRAMAILEKSTGPDHPYVAWIMCDMGRGLLDKGKPELALEPLERVVKLCQTSQCESEPNGRGLFSLARALLATKGDQQRAVELARQALVLFGKTPKAFKRELEEVDTWLNEHDHGLLSATH